jgi:hypothetical protein
MCNVCAIVLFATLAVQGSAGGSSEVGSASGVVLDDAGKPLADATVYALPAEDMTHQIRGTSDSAGRFVLEGLPAGTVYIDAYKESDGYPYNMFSFFKVPGANTPVSMKVVAGKATGNIVLHLGQRSAYLQLDVSADEGAPAGGALLFDRLDIPGPYIRGVLANDKIMVPLVPFRLTFQAEGYLPWHYGGESWQTGAGLIKLKSGETLHLAIRVKRALPSK